MIVAVNFPIGKKKPEKNQGFNGIRTRDLENLLRRSFFTLIYHRSSHMNYFIYASHHFTPHGRYELNKLTSLPMCGFIAQLVEHRTGIAEVTGSNPVEALIFFFSGFFFPIAYIGKFTATIILHFDLPPQFTYELFHICFTPLWFIVISLMFFYIR